MKPSLLLILLLAPALCLTIYSIELEYDAGSLSQKDFVIIEADEAPDLFSGQGMFTVVGTGFTHAFTPPIFASVGTTVEILNKTTFSIMIPASAFDASSEVYIKDMDGNRALTLQKPSSPTVFDMGAVSAGTSDAFKPASLKILEDVVVKEESMIDQIIAWILEFLSSLFGSGTGTQPPSSGLQTTAPSSSPSAPASTTPSGTTRSAASLCDRFKEYHALALKKEHPWMTPEKALLFYDVCIELGFTNREVSDPTEGYAWGCEGAYRSYLVVTNQAMAASTEGSPSDALTQASLKARDSLWECEAGSASSSGACGTQSEALKKAWDSYEKQRDAATPNQSYIITARTGLTQALGAWRGCMLNEWKTG